MRDLSIDLETLSLSYDAQILSIGAVFFDAETGVMGRDFYRSITVGSDPVGHFDPDTEAWWKGQDPRASSVLRDPLADPAGVVLADFYQWVRSDSWHYDPSVRPWGNGSIFDIVILENAFRRFNIKTPWKFWDVRDVRTVADFAGVSRYDIPFEGIAHFALDDAKHQAKIVCEAYRRAPGRLRREQAP